MSKRPVNKKVKEAIAEYVREQEELKKEDSVNIVVELWNKLGKTGQVLTLVLTILTTLTGLKPYAVDTYKWVANFIQSVETTQEHDEAIEKLEKYNEVTSSILKAVLYPGWHVNPDGKKIKLYQTREVDGQHMTYYFQDCCIFFAANYNVETRYWYYIDDSGVYHEITE